jgi:hypothetical protein
VSGAPRKVKVFLSGEGANELGSRAGHPAYQSDERPGVLHSLLSRVQPTGWVVGHACDWKNIRKYRVRGTGATHDDTHNVLAAALDAKERGCEVLAFSRDVDSNPERREAIAKGIRLVPSVISSAPPEVIGGVAVPTLEGWILALLGERATEELSPTRAQATLSVKGVAPKDGAAMTRAVEKADLESLPKDADSLREWLSRAQAILPRRVAMLEGRRFGE